MHALGVAYCALGGLGRTLGTAGLAAFALARHALAAALRFVTLADHWADTIVLPGNTCRATQV